MTAGSPPPNLEVRYENTLEDLLALNAWVVGDLHRRRRARSALNLGFGLLLVTFAVVVVDVGWAAAWPLYAFVGLLGVVGLWVAPALERRRLTEEVVRGWRSDADGGPRRLALHPDGLSATTGDRTRQVAWDAIARVERVGEHLFVLVTAETAYVLPRRAFPDERAFVDAADRAARWWRAAHVTRKPPGAGA